MTSEEALAAVGEHMRSGLASMIERLTELGGDPSQIRLEDGPGPDQIAVRMPLKNWSEE